MSIYRWRGVDPHGTRKFGLADWPDLAAEVRARFEKGWRDLTVCRGEGPVPPPAIGPADIVASIEKHPDHGRRIWWAET